MEPTREQRSAKGPLRFHRAAEARGYPALLLVAMGCLTAVVAAVALLALIPTWFAVAFAVLTLLVAVAALLSATTAAFTDAEDSERAEVEPMRTSHRLETDREAA